MAQSVDINVANQSGPNVRNEINDIFGAIVSSHMGASQPSYVVAGQTWIDNAANPYQFKFYDGTSSWALFKLDITTDKVVMTNVGDGGARIESANVGQIQDSKFHWGGTAGGTANARTITLSPAITAYVAGQTFRFTVPADNTGTVTLAVNGLTAKTIQKRGNALEAGDLTGTVEVIYDGTQFQMVTPASPFSLGVDSISPDMIDTTVNAIGSIGGGTQDIDLDLGRSVSGTVDTSTTTFTFSNPKATGNEDIFTLRLTNGGSQTINWPASVDWVGGIAPTLTASGVDELTFKTIDGGTIWVGLVALDVK